MQEGCKESATVQALLDWGAMLVAWLQATELVDLYIWQSTVIRCGQQVGTAAASAACAMAAYVDAGRWIIEELLVAPPCLLVRKAAGCTCSCVAVLSKGFTAQGADGLADKGAPG